MTRAYYWMRGDDFSRKLMIKNTQSLKQTRRLTLVAVSDPVVHASKRNYDNNETDVENNEIDKEVEYLIFDAASGNVETEEKGTINDLNLLE